MNIKGFTLIELLAVIIILGILMIIAIPSVTKYISDSRKNTYIGTAKEIISGARNMVNEGKLEMFDTDTTYYIDVNCIKTENGTQSPYGEFTKAYVIVTYDGKGYDYYWTSVDDAGQGISKITEIDNLDIDKIESDLKDNDIPNSLGVDGRSEYIIIDKEHTNCGKGVATTVTDVVDGETGVNLIKYPEGKNRLNVEKGEFVTIGTEEFVVINNDKTNLTLLARYNINVGEKKDPNIAEGIQFKELNGLNYIRDLNGFVPFSNTSYWGGKVGTTYSGHFCQTSSSPTDCVYVYDSNSNLYSYVNSYKNYIHSLGQPVKEARLLSMEEAFELRSINRDAWKQTSYWLGNPYNNNWVWGVDYHGNFDIVIMDGDLIGGVGKDYMHGVRPVIVI